MDLALLGQGTLGNWVSRGCGLRWAYPLGFVDSSLHGDGHGSRRVRVRLSTRWCPEQRLLVPVWLGHLAVQKNNQVPLKAGGGWAVERAALSMSAPVQAQ